MQRNKTEITQRWSLWWLLLVMVSCSSKKNKQAAFIEDAANGLIQVKNVHNKTIGMELLPVYDLPAEDKTAAVDFYRVRLLLRSNEKIKNPATMQYLNFDMQHSFYAVQDADTLPCAICERIPGIYENDYLYMVFFTKPGNGNLNSASLHLFVADTVAGFGMTEFEIKNESLKKLEALKYLR